MILPGSTYTILDTLEPIFKRHVGDQILIEEVIEGSDPWHKIRGHTREGTFTFWARLGALQIDLCRCSYMSFPHRRTAKCQDPA